MHIMLLGNNPETPLATSDGIWQYLSASKWEGIKWWLLGYIDVTVVHCSEYYKWLMK